MSISINMENRNSIIIPILTKLAKYEADYIRSACTRKELERRLHEIKNDYESVQKHFTQSDMNYIAIMLLFLERIKTSLELEDEIIRIIDCESSRFNSNITKVLEDLKQSFKNIQRMSTQDGSASLDGSMKAKRTNYPKQTSHILKKWLQENAKDPYPSDTEKAILREKTGLDATQLNNWFINARRRILPFLRENNNRHKGEMNHN
ncbi:hypothetical protein H311_02800 [Anncaliia algerae PRA109]|nr:hypothetical protein H311_02800 [Anncaliia algerae PRA109]